MAIDPNIVLAGRQVRTQWRLQEEQFMCESLAYAKRSMSILDFLGSVAHSGNEVCVSYQNHEICGPFTQIGKDYFSIISKDDENINSFFTGDLSSNSFRAFEIQILDRTPQSESSQLHRHNKSFRYLLDEVIAHDDGAEIQVLNGSIFTGSFDLFLDFISVTPDQKLEKTFVKPGTKIIPISSISRLVYPI